MSIQDKLDRAKAAPLQTGEVTVALRSDVAKRREDLQAQLDAALAKPDDRLGKKSDAKKLVEQMNELLLDDADALLTLQFTELPGDEWSTLEATHPARPEAPLDRQYGYNVDDACKHAATINGCAVDGDDLKPLTVEQWNELWPLLSGYDFGEVRDTIWRLNVWQPTVRVEQLKKVSRPGSDQT